MSTKRVPVRPTTWAGYQENGPPGECPACGSVVGALHDDSCVYEECPSCGDQLVTCSCSEGFAVRAHAAVCGGMKVEEAIITYAVTLEAIQEVCDSYGHEWTHWEAGDPATPYYSVGNDFCEICHADRPEPDDL